MAIAWRTSAPASAPLARGQAGSEHAPVNRKRDISHPRNFFYFSPLRRGRTTLLVLRPLVSADGAPTGRRMKVVTIR